MNLMCSLTTHMPDQSLECSLLSLAGLAQDKPRVSKKKKRTSLHQQSWKECQSRDLVPL